MKTIEAVKNFLNVLDENNIVDLFYIEERDTEKRRSICFLNRVEAERTLKYLIHQEPTKEFYIRRTSVFFG